MLIQNTRLPFAGYLLCLTLLTLQACATLDPDSEQPTVTFSSFRALPSDGTVPSCEIGLNILNPNTSEFRFEGFVFEVSVQGLNPVKDVGKH